MPSGSKVKQSVMVEKNILKVGLLCIKMMNNAFCFILKALFVLKIFKFLSWLFGHAGKTAWLERED